MAKEKSFTYPATFSRSISGGGKVELNLDLGFDMHVRQVFVIKDIWTPTVIANDHSQRALAYRAKAFVDEKLTNAIGIMVESFKLHDVYLGNICYQNKSGGHWHDLGAKLLKHELAELRHAS